MHWDQRRQAADRVHRRRGQAARAAPDVPPQALLHRQDRAHRRRRARRAPQRHRLAAPRRPPDGGRRLGRGGQAIGMYLNGHGIAGQDARGGTITDDHFLLYFNADGPADVTLPARRVRRSAGTSSSTPAASADTAATLRGRRRPLALTTAQPASCCASTPSPSRSPTTRSPRRWRRWPTPAPRTARPRRTSDTGTTRRPSRTGPFTRRAPCARPSAPTGSRSPRTSTCSRRRGVLPYLHDLGVDWVYLSPLLAAEPGSDHGYDVVDHDRDRPGPRRGRGPGGGVGRGPPARAWACWSTSCPTTSASRRRERQRVVVGRAHARPGLGVRRRLRHRLGRRRRARSGSRCVGDDDLADGRRHRPPAPSRRAQLRYHDHALPARARQRRPDWTTTGSTAHDVHARQHYELVVWRPADAELNYRRFFAVNTLAAIRVEEPRVVRRLARRDRPLVRRGPRRRPARRPPRRPARPRGLPRRPRRPDRRRLRAGREDPRARRGAARRLGDRRHHRVRRAGTARPGAHRPGAGEAAGRARRAAARRTRSTGPRWCTTPSAPSPTASCAPRSGGSAASCASRSPTPRPTPRTPSPSCSPASRSTAPTCPAAASTSTRPFDLAREHRPDLAATLDVLLPVLARPRAAAGPALPADQRHGDGQGRRGLRVLPLVAADLAQRGRRRPVDLRRRPPSDFHDAMADRQRDWPHAMTALSTHDTKRGEDVRARITVLAEVPDAVGRRPRPAARPGPAARPRLRQPALAGRRRAPGPRPGSTATCASGCTATPRRRCARPATAPPGPRPTRPTRPPCTPRSTPPSTTRACAPWSTEVLDRRSPTPAGATPWPPSCSR